MTTRFLEHFREQLAGLEGAGLYKHERTITSAQSAEIEVGGRKVLNFCANNYLGLAGHPEVEAAAHAAIHEHGYGMASVRFICGTQDVHRELEKRIAAFLGMTHPSRVRSLVFGGLGLNMVRGVAGTGPIARALEAESIDDVKNDTARTFRAFAEQTKSDLKALAACIRSARAPITAEALGALRCPVLVVVGEKDVIGGSAARLAELIPGAQGIELLGRDHNKAVGDKGFKQAVLAFFASLR